MPVPLTFAPGLTTMPIRVSVIGGWLAAADGHHHGRG